MDEIQVGHARVPVYPQSIELLETLDEYLIWSPGQPKAQDRRDKMRAY